MEEQGRNKGASRWLVGDATLPDPPRRDQSPPPARDASRAVLGADAERSLRDEIEANRTDLRGLELVVEAVAERLEALEAKLGDGPGGGLG